MIFEFALFGKHYNSEEDIYYPKLQVEYSNLKYWMDKDPFSINILDEFSLVKNSVKKLDVYIDKFGFRINSIYSFQDITEDYESAGFKFFHFLIFEPDEPKNLESTNLSCFYRYTPIP